MLKNYLVIAFRSIKKNKIFSFINIVGLAIGIAAFLLIAQYLSYETSYDKFHTNAGQLYRVTLNQYLNNELMISSAENYPGIGPALKEEAPEVKSYARLYNMGYKNNVIVSWDDAPDEPIKFKHRKLLYADSSFLPMFNYPMVKGDAANALSNPNSIVISEEYAQNYFDNEDPIGKMLHLKDDDYNDELLKVTGVFKNLPSNTHLKFDVLISYSTLFSRFETARQRYDYSWNRKDMYVYILLQHGTDPDKVKNHFPVLLQKYSPDLASKNRRDEFDLQAVTSIHLNSNLAEEVEPNGKASSVYALALIAIFILIIAWVNYINLSTAKANNRANEVGVRKAMGAFKKQLVIQFLIESGLINLFSIILSLILVIIILPSFNQIAGVSFTFFGIFNIWFVVLLFTLWLIGTLLSGLYPAFILSSFKPVTVLKGKLRTSAYGIILRKSLVVFQFIASVALIAGTIIVYNQINFMTNKDIGLNIDQVLVLERPGASPRDRDQFMANVDFFRQEVLKNDAVKAITTSVTIPGKKREYKDGVKKYGAGDDESAVLRWNSMDYSFIDVFEMELIAGRTFSPDFPNDPDTSVILTISAAEALGFKNPEEAIGQVLEIPDFQWNPIVVGVVNDYHQESLQKAKDPMIFYCTAYNGEFYSMKVSGENISKTIEHVENSWNKAFAGNPFQYFFLDDFFNRQYEREQKFGSLFTSFSILAIIVGCLGLFGLSSYTAEQKTKEIGVRKILGSSISGIFVHLTKDYLKLILIAICIATPLTYYIMNQWLNGFAYKEEIPIIIFILTSSLVIFLALLTVSYQTIRAARRNPIESLRYE